MSKTYRSKLRIFSSGEQLPWPSAAARRRPAPPEVSVPDALRDVVAPVLAQVLRPGELESMTLWWAADVDYRDHALTDSTSLQLEVTCVGEHFSKELWSTRMTNFDVVAVGDDLRSALQEFVAESDFGWGEQR